MSDEIDSNSAALGSAFATLALTVNCLVVLTKKGLITDKDAHDVVMRARAVIRGGAFPVAPDALQAALQVLDAAQQLFLAATASASKPRAN